MKIERQLTLKNGAVCRIYEAGAQDAAGVLENLRRTSAETDYMLRYPDEIRLTEQKEAEFLAGMAADPAALMLCAAVEGRVAGCASYQAVGPLARVRHRAECGVSVQKAYWGLGIGRALMETLLAAAADAGFAQMELDVVAENVPARRLYERLGFVEYGTRPHSFRYRDGRSAALVLMAKPLQAHSESDAT